MKKITFSMLMLIAVSVLTVSCSDDDDKGSEQKDIADLVVYGNIFTADNDKVVEAFAVKDGKFVYVGDKEGVADFIKEGQTQVVNHTDKGMVIPGITDGHAHYMMKFINEQMKDNTLQFTGEQSYRQVLEQVRDFVEKAAQGGRHLDYVYGEGYNIVTFMQDGPDPRHCKDLDAITTEIPIFLTGFDHHSTLVNTRAMINAGILDEDGNVLRDHIAGGFMYRDEEGKLNGVFSERAISLLMGPGLNGKMCPTSGQVSQGIEDMQRYLHSVGITNIIEGWTNYYGKDDESLFKALADWDKDNKLHLNVALTYEIEPWYNNNDPFGYVENAAAVRDRYQSSHVHPDYIKLFMDGLVEMGTGFLLGQYSESPTDSIYSGHGTPLWSEEDMKTLVSSANSKGLTVHTHALGDGAVHRCVVAYSTAGKDELRNTIVHLRNVGPDDYAVMKEHNIAIASNMNWHCNTEELAAIYATIIPHQYAYNAYPIKSFFDNSILVSQCTDTPADDGINYPFHCMQVAVTGTFQPEMNPWQPEELIDRCQFLQAMTYNGAWQLHLEKERGSIKVGKYADFVLVNQDVFSCPVTDIHKTKVVSTWFEGKQVYPIP